MEVYPFSRSSTTPLLLEFSTNQRRPCLAVRVPLAGMLSDVTAATERRYVVEVEQLAAILDGRDVMAFQAPGSAASRATETVPLKGLQAYPLPFPVLVPSTQTPPR